MGYGRQIVKQTKQEMLQILKEFSLENSNKENDWTFKFPLTDIYLDDEGIIISPKLNSSNEIQISYESLCSIYILKLERLIFLLTLVR